MIYYNQIVANKSPSFKVTTQYVSILPRLKVEEYHFKHHIFDDF